MGEIIFAVCVAAAIWGWSALIVLRVGVNRSDINADTLDGVMLFGPFAFLIVAWVAWTDAIRPALRRAYRERRKANGHS